MIATLAAVLADAGNGHMDWDDSWWMWIWGPITMIVLVTAVIWAIRASTGTRPGAGGHDADPTRSARQILAERYARGEIDTDEYHQRLEHLK